MPLNNTTKVNLNNQNKKTIQIPIDNNFICLRSLNPNRSRFEVEYSLEKGSCTNSFFVQLPFSRAVSYTHLTLPTR